jgi:hypothetical protein
MGVVAGVLRADVAPVGSVYRPTRAMADGLKKRPDGDGARSTRELHQTSAMSPGLPVFERGFIPDAIASRSLTPLLNESADVLIAFDADWVAPARIAEALGTAYAPRLTDGARHADR